MRHSKLKKRTLSSKQYSKIIINKPQTFFHFYLVLLMMSFWCYSNVFDATSVNQKQNHKGSWPTCAHVSLLNSSKLRAKDRSADKCAHNCKKRREKRRPRLTGENSCDASKGSMPWTSPMPRRRCIRCRWQVAIPRICLVQALNLMQPGDGFYAARGKITPAGFYWTRTRCRTIQALRSAMLPTRGWTSMTGRQRTYFTFSLVICDDLTVKPSDTRQNDQRWQH